MGLFLQLGCSTFKRQWGCFDVYHHFRWNFTLANRNGLYSMKIELLSEKLSFIAYIFFKA